MMPAERALHILHECFNNYPTAVLLADAHLGMAMKTTDSEEVDYWAEVMFILTQQKGSFEA